MIKPVPGQDGYFISDAGIVYSQWINKGKHGLHKGFLKPLRGSRSKTGHISIRFGRNGKVALIHRLVYEVFVGPIPKGMYIRHLNDIPDDNRLENLAVGTQKENMEDARRNGVFPVGSRQGISKLEESDIPVIRSLLEKHTQTEIANKFGVSRRTISFIKNRQTWKHVD